MAISISEDEDSRNNLISDFFDGDSDQLDPCFAAFKRIDRIFDDNCYFYNIIDNPKLTDKISVRVDFLEISNKNHFDDMRELYKDKDPNLMIENLQLNYNFKRKRSAQDIELINKISPKILTIERGVWTVENIKDLAFLNCTNVDLQFSVIRETNIYFWFINTPIQLFDSQSDQMFAFEWESIKFFIEKYEFEEDEKNRIEEVKLLDTNTNNYLFIPLNTIGLISYSRFREILNVDDINKQFSDLRVQHQFKENGLIIPMRYSNRIFIKLDDEDLDYLNQYKDINKIFKEKHIEIKIKSLSRLLKINKLLPDYFSRIRFKYYDDCSTNIAEYSISEIMKNPDWINFKFIHIYKSSTLSLDEFQFWCKMLHFGKTRFNLIRIELRFSLLSECLTVLSLCSGCPELDFVELGYLVADAEDEHETISQAKRDFRHKFEFIQNLIIWKVRKLI